MNYQKIYDQLILKVQSENRGIKREKGFHIHHILPKSMDGSDEKENFIKLTYKEHFIAHELLWKATKDSKMLWALFYMACRKINFWKCSPKTYKKLNETRSKIQSKRVSGKGNPHYGESNYDIWMKKYGKDKAEQLMLKYSITMSISVKENNYIANLTEKEYENFCKLKSENHFTKKMDDQEYKEYCIAISNRLKNKGKTTEHCQNISKSLIANESVKGENNPRFGDHRSWEEIHGKEKSDKLKKQKSNRKKELSPRYIKISEETQKEICKLYEEGETVINLIKIFNFGPIKRVLQENNIHIRTPSEVQILYTKSKQF